MYISEQLVKLIIATEEIVNVQDDGQVNFCNLIISKLFIYQYIMSYPINIFRCQLKIKELEC